MTKDANDFNFSLKLKEQEVTLDGEKYVLREPSGEAGAEHDSMRTSGAIVENGQIVGYRGLGQLEPILVSKCLFKLDANGEIQRDPQGRPLPVALETILSWPDRVISRLYAKAQEMGDLNYLGEKVEERRKNESDPSMVGSD